MKFCSVIASNVKTMKNPNQMNVPMKNTSRHLTVAANVLLIALLLISSPAWSREHVRGVLRCDAASEPQAFGTVALLSMADSTMVSGTISDEEGRFSLTIPSDNKKAPYFLRITYVGYKTTEVAVDSLPEAGMNLGYICLTPLLQEMQEFVFVGERISASGGNTKTTYFMNSKIRDASFTAGDVLRHIPEVHVDFMQHISMEGGQPVVIQVNGRERDAAFIRQLDASQIDRIEVVRNPGAQYDAGISGVINIILKEPESGLRTHVHAEVPTSASEVYIFPNYGLHFTRGKVNLFTTYQGEVSQLDVVESNNRKFRFGGAENNLASSMQLRQDHWSHRFNAGLDYIMNERTQLNVYGFINPYSRENSGTVVLQSDAGQSETRTWSAAKQDTDKNLLAFGSVYFRHDFKPGAEITLDAGYYRLKAENTTVYAPKDTELSGFSAGMPASADSGQEGDTGIGAQDDRQINTLKPNQHTIYLKADFSAPVSEKLGIAAGGRINYRNMQDDARDGFAFAERVLAAYGSIRFSGGDLSIQAGLRAEFAQNGENGHSGLFTSSLLPSFSASFRTAPNRQIQLTFRQSVRRPHIYEISPTPIMDDPYSIRFGNPLLQAEKRSTAAAGYSLLVGNTFIQSQVFCQHFFDVINWANHINEHGQFVTRVGNLGNIIHYGAQLSGSLNFHPAVSINPGFRVFQVNTRPNSRAGELGIEPVQKVSFEAGLSVIARLHEGLTASLAGQYFSPTTDLQQITYSNMLYFISLEKNLPKNWRIGITSALPLQRSFTYHGTRMNGTDLNRHAEGNILMSAVPVWLKVSYQFDSGKKIQSVKRQIENFEGKPKIGF